MIEVFEHLLDRFESSSVSECGNAIKIFFAIESVYVFGMPFFVQLLERFHAAVRNDRRIRSEAILAGPTAACCGDAEDFGSGHVVGDGFLFDWVYMAGYYLSIHVELQLSAVIAPYSAKTDLAFADVAVSCACRTSDPAVGQLLIQGRFFTDSQFRSLFWAGLDSLEPIDTFSLLP